MNKALRIALLEHSDAIESWLAGRLFFEQSALPEEAGEGRLLIQMQERARRDVRAEGTHLTRLFPTLRDRPGAWALYPVTGQILRFWAKRPTHQPKETV